MISYENVLKKKYFSLLKYLKSKKNQKAIFLVLFIPITTPVVLGLLFLGRIYPGIDISGISLGGKTFKEAKIALSDINPPEKLVLIEPAENHESRVILDSIEFEYDIEKSINSALRIGRSGNYFFDISQVAKALINKKSLGFSLKYNQDKFNEHLQAISGQVYVEPIYPDVKIQNQQVVITKGKKGQKVDLDRLRATMLLNLSFRSNDPVQIPISIIDPTITNAEVEKLIVRAEKLLNKKLNLKSDFQTFEYQKDDLVALIDPYPSPMDGYNQYSEANISKIVSNVSDKLNREPQNATFRFESGRVREFLPALDGIKVKTDSLKQKILEALNKLENTDEVSTSVNVPVEKTAPEIHTEDVNDLGIKELIGKGSSKYIGSISSRVYNISLAASRLNGVLIKPGQTFSFNAALGEVDKLTGYKSAYIIKDGQTVLGDGGGVCQVSTTFFRAALNAGLPIVERRAHSYRVGYYEQGAPVGLDATVYSPTADLKIKNDTPAHILVQAYANPRNSSLIFEFYGTKDGRVASTAKPIVTDVTPPPEDLYIDDPTLPAGKIEQIDYKAWGAKARFTYTVKKKTEVIFQKTFYSNYRPWQAKFLRGTGPVN